MQLRHLRESSRLRCCQENAKYILHAVGPIWHGGNEGEAEKLKSCYVGCLEKATEVGCTSVAFCCISVGVYHYPLKAATRLAISTVRDWLEQYHSNMLVKFCCYTDREFDCYWKIAEELGIYG